MLIFSATFTAKKMSVEKSFNQSVFARQPRKILTAKKKSVGKIFNQSVFARQPRKFLTASNLPGFGVENEFCQTAKKIPDSQQPSGFFTLVKRLGGQFVRPKALWIGPPGKFARRVLTASNLPRKSPSPGFGARTCIFPLWLALREAKSPLDWSARQICPPRPGMRPKSVFSFLSLGI